MVRSEVQSVAEVAAGGVAAVLLKLEFDQRLPQELMCRTDDARLSLGRGDERPMYEVVPDQGTCPESSGKAIAFENPRQDRVEPLEFEDAGYGREMKIFVF